MKLYGVVSGLFLPETLWEFAAKPKMASKYFQEVRELKLDLVILNVSMPVMRGVEAARKVDLRLCTSSLFIVKQRK
jgi:CheY-like chemotaxis protein